MLAVARLTQLMLDNPEHLARSFQDLLHIGILAARVGLQRQQFGKTDDRV